MAADGQDEPRSTPAAALPSSLTADANCPPAQAEAPDSGDPARLGWWTRIAVRAGQVVAAMSRRAGRGSGSIIGGRVTLALDPSALRRLAAGRRVVLVSGTNGKTTTSHMLAAALGSLGPVAHNALGSNMADGAVAALAERLDAKRAVLEIDELHLASVARCCDPSAIVLLNLSRDQLDRAAEVRRTAASIAGVLSELPGTTVLANADDPMTVWAAENAAGPVEWVAAGSKWRADSLSCPRCGRLLVETKARWSCDCGLARPQPVWWLDGELACHLGSSIPLSLGLPGEVNRANALMALAAAGHARVPLRQAGDAIAQVRQVAGRYAAITRGPHVIRLLLAKNPAGWSATLSMLGTARPLVIAVNARDADGRDTSWLWDVDFAALDPRPTAASGERAADVGVRLSYAGIDHHTEPDPLAALGRLPAGDVDMVANYTAFYSLRQRLAAGE
jgi:UDP-N-acetylmuramyl tripeptide synthase